MTQMNKTTMTDAKLYIKYALTLTPQSPLIFNQIWLNYQDDKARLAPKKKFTLADMRLAYDLVLQEMEQEKLAEMSKSLLTTGSNLAPITQWVKAVTGDTKDADVMTMAHWLWMVKRQAMDRTVVYHLFIILHGRAQGAGKSTAIRKLLGPLGAFRIDMDANEIGDPNTFADMANYLAVFLDELAALSKLDSTKLKKQITTDFNSFRPFYTQKRIQVKKRTSYIGASNKSIKQIFYDSTGMRRFYQIETSKIIDRELINSIDYKALWLGIDENLERGYFNESNWDAISKIQAKYVNKEDYEDFLEEFNITPGNGTHKAVKLSDVYQAYFLWSRVNGYRFQQSRAQFKVSLDSLGYSIAGDILKVNPDCTLDLAKLAKEEQTVLEFKKEDA